MAGGRSKYSASLSCQRHCGCQVIPQRSFGPWSKKWGKPPTCFCIGPAPDMQAKAVSPLGLAAVTSQPGAAGEEGMSSTPLTQAAGIRGHVIASSAAG